MKTKLPLPNETKMPWTAEFCKQVGFPFHAARYWKISFTESDVKYIENVIKLHKAYRIIYKQGAEREIKNNLQKIQRYNTETEFLTPFMNDPRCPTNVSNFLYLYLGRRLQYIKSCGCEQQQMLRDQFFAQRWQETCR